jgi:signal transduction histidine kinase
MDPFNARVDRATKAPAPHLGLIGPGWLRLAQLGWAAIALLVLALYIASIVANVTEIWMPVSPRVAEGLHSLGVSPQLYQLYLNTLELVVGTVLLAVGAWIFSCRADKPVAILVSLLLLCYGINESNLSEVLQRTALAPLVFWPVRGTYALGEALSLFIFCVFPDGRFVPAWTRPVALSYAGLVGLWLVVPDLPLNAVHGEAFYRTPLASTLLGMVVHGVGAYALVYRYLRVDDPTQRRQLQWIVFGLLVVTVVAMTRYAANSLNHALGLIASEDMKIVFDTGLRSVYRLSLLVVPLCFGVAILRHQLWNISTVINRTLVYGALTLSVIAGYIAIVVSLGALFHTSDNLLISLFATGLVAVLFQPLRVWLQRSINRLMYGNRDEPYSVLSRLTQQLEAALTPMVIFPTIVKTVAQELKLPYVAIALAPDEAGAEPPSAQMPPAAFAVAAASGAPTSNVVALPLLYQGELIGQLRVAPRPGSEGFRPSEHRLLVNIAHQTAIAAHTVRLSADLKRSRERIVIAREEERNRLHRDLHDGLGPTLAGQALAIETACLELERDPAAARRLLEAVHTRTRGMVAEIRRIVYDLRPPVLGELGLIAAIREALAQLEQPSLCIEFQAPEQLPPLSAATEVAIYRIVLEAVTNVVRHARAERCYVSLRDEDNRLLIEITDNGRGLPLGYRAGVGISSMRERAAELGGSCTLGASAEGGTRVSVWLAL